MIIVGYPCIGKSTYANSHGYNVIDLESSNFIKDEWIERLHNRYLNTELEKDYRAWQRAASYYDEDVIAFKEDAKHFHGFYEIGHEPEGESYDITSTLDEFEYGC